VDGEEDLQQLAESDHLRVEGYLHALSMPGFAGANCFV
jgi:hypothetical protein